MFGTMCRRQIEVALTALNLEGRDVGLPRSRKRRHAAPGPRTACTRWRARPRWSGRPEHRGSEHGEQDAREGEQDVEAGRGTVSVSQPPTRPRATAQQRCRHDGERRHQDDHEDRAPASSRLTAGRGPRRRSRAWWLPWAPTNAYEMSSWFGAYGAIAGPRDRDEHGDQDYRGAHVTQDAGPPQSREATAACGWSGRCLRHLVGYRRDVLIALGSPSVTRGSSTAYRMSTIVFVTTNTVTSTRLMPWTVAKSLLSAALTRYSPSPLRLNAVSTTAASAMRLAIVRPETVTIGIAAFPGRGAAPPGERRYPVQSPSERARDQIPRGPRRASRGRRVRAR